MVPLPPTRLIATLPLFSRDRRRYRRYGKPILISVYDSRRRVGAFVLRVFIPRSYVAKTIEMRFFQKFIPFNDIKKLFIAGRQNGDIETCAFRSVRRETLLSNERPDTVVNTYAFSAYTIKRHKCTCVCTRDGAGLRTRRRINEEALPGYIDE